MLRLVSYAPPSFTLPFEPSDSCRNHPASWRYVMREIKGLVFRVSGLGRHFVGPKRGRTRCRLSRVLQVDIAMCQCHILPSALPRQTGFRFES